ncbi:hypothetical protein SAMN05421766_10245 [Zobellia uliginosa]|uniref:Uncharacterized protein n=1 Tax=Zobellia uliginosa TaxID=143224 RepID=A0ABY1KPI2_9FLAO|nr:hypothetical protein SAMN05421766_10245 [Zobellia uliginosa]
MSKSKRFGGLSKYPHAFKYSTLCPICYSHCACCTTMNSINTYLLGYFVKYN